MRRVGIVSVVLTAVLLLGGAALVAIRIQHLLNRTSAEVAGEANLAFDLRTLTRFENPGFEPLPAPGNYTSGAVFQGSLYLAGPGGLAVLPLTEAQAHEAAPGETGPRLLRTGLDWPAAPIVSMVAGMLRGDSRRQLILATRGEGVLWYDGQALRQLQPQLAAARDVTAVLPLLSGDLLIGTRELGLLHFNGKRLTEFHPGLAKLNVTALAGDEGNFWVGTRNRGVFHWHAGQVDNFDIASGDGAGLPDSQVESIAIFRDTAYVGTPMGVEEFKSGHPSRTLVAGFFAHAVFTDGDTLTVASIDEGVREVALTSKRPRHGSNDEMLQAESFFTRNDPATGGIIGASSDLLAATKDGVFRRMPSGEWQRMLASGSSPLADRNVAALGFAPDGRLWIGYFDRGLDIVDVSNRAADEQGNSLHVEHVEDDHVFCINRILSDPIRQTMDVATANGLVLFDTAGRERQVLLRKDGLIADQVTDVALTSEGTVVATPAGLTFIDASGMQSLYAFHGLVNNHVYSLAGGHAPGGGLLAGTLGGISYLQLQRVRRNFTTANSALKHNWTTAIVSVGDGWFVGTYGAGVMRLDSEGHFSAMDGANNGASGAMEINPNAMLVTPQHVFAGSLGDGLLCYSLLSQRWLRMTAGLPSLDVTAIAEHDGQIYVGTDNGLVRIAEARLPQ